MILFISDDNYQNIVKSIWGNMIFTCFLALLGGIYELFSHEVYSYYMLYAFAIPLVLGVLLQFLTAYKKWRLPNDACLSMWNLAVATLAIGSVFKGILDIYGTTNKLVYAYPIASIILFGISFVMYFRKRNTPKEAELNG